MTSTRTRKRSQARLVWGILIAGILLALPALAQDPVVTAADPPSAEQETLDLEVTITGENFAKDAAVRFLVTGTETEGGIRVKKVKTLGPGKLKATVDVDADAVVDDFDIEVMSRGRTGKGIELFKVIEKVNPVQDTTPPGEPTDLQVLDVKHGSVLVSFTMPADDGYDPSSGPAAPCPIYVTPSEMPNAHWIGDYPWGQPGEEEFIVLTSLKPGTEYSFSIRCYDEVGGNVSNEVQFVESTRPFSEMQDLSWAVTEVPVHLDYLIGHRFDAAGNVVIAGTVGTYTKKGWRIVLVSSAIRIITGTWDSGSGSWNWSFEDVAGFANRLASHPGGHPSFAGQELTDTTPLAAYEVTYTFFDGSTWETEVVSSFETEYSRSPGFAFDPYGQPGISWCAGASSPGVRLARRDATGQWSIEDVNSADCDGREITVLAFDDSGNPAIVWTHREDPYDLRFSYRSPQGWSEEFVDALPPGDPWSIKSVALTYEPARSDFTAVWDSGVKVSVCDRTGGQGWDCQIAMPLGAWTESELMFDGAGERLLGVVTEARFDVALARRAPAQSAWAVEHVDHPSTRGFWEWGFDINGPYLALDPGRPPLPPLPDHKPSLSWLWGDIGGAEGPSEEVHLYFAWKP